MKWRVRLTGRAEGSLRRTPKHIQDRVAEPLDVPEESPVPFRTHDVAKFKGYRHAYRVRLGDWRVIYEVQIHDRLILVYRIEPRERAYE